MATYDSLTAQQKADIALYDNYLRGVVKELGKFKAKSDPDTWNTFAASQVDPVLATVDAGEVIPNSTSLPGAYGLSQSEFLTLQGIARGLISTFETNKALLLKAAGPANVTV